MDSRPGSTKGVTDDLPVAREHPLDPLSCGRNRIGPQQRLRRLRAGLPRKRGDRASASVADDERRGSSPGRGLDVHVRAPRALHILHRRERGGQPWPPFHLGRGLPPESSVVSLSRATHPTASRIMRAARRTSSTARSADRWPDSGTASTFPSTPTCSSSVRSTPGRSPTANGRRTTSRATSTRGRENVSAALARCGPRRGHEPALRQGRRASQPRTR